MLSSLTEKPNGFGIWGRHDCLENLINLHVGGKAVALLLRVLPVLALTQLGTNASLQKRFKHTTKSLYLKSLKLQYVLFHDFIFIFYFVESGALPTKPVRFWLLFLLDLTGHLSVYIATVLSDIYYSDFFSQGVGVLWSLEQLEQSPRGIIILDCPK